jgi:hypothetical protein
MLSPALPLKLSVAGIRLTGYVIETNFRIARVLGQAALKAGALSMPRGTAVSGSAAKHAGLGKGTLEKPVAAGNLTAPVRPKPLTRPKPALRVAPLVKMPAADIAAVEIPSAPVAKAAPKPDPVSSITAAPKADVPTPAKADIQPVVTPQAEMKPEVAPAAPAAAKVTAKPDVPSKDAGATVAVATKPVVPASEKPADPAAVKRPRAPSMPPALPENAKKAKVD